MDHRPEFSLIISTKDRPESLKVLFSSLRLQVNPPSYEIIVVDDASSVGYEELSNDAQVWLRNEVSLGPSYNRNLAAGYARGKYLLFLDDDTELRPSSLWRLGEIFAHSPNLGVLGGCGPRHRDFYDEVDHISIKTITAGINHKEIIRNPKLDLIYGDHLESAFMAVPTHVFKKSGGFDPYWFYMGEDRDLCLQIKALGYEVAASWSARAIHDNISSYGTDDLARRRSFRFKRIIEVSLKQFGFLETLLHICKERQKILRYLSYKDLFTLLKEYPSLKARKGVDFLAHHNLTPFLTKRLPEVKGPKQIVLFLNNRCNAACEHCFIPDLNSKTHEVALPHWLDLLKTLPGPYSLTLTGGETMLTEGIEDFIRAVFEQTNCDYVGVLTNGSLPEATFKLATNITREFPTRKFKVQLSLDGTEVRHNLIRKNRHSYALALKTASLLQKLTAKNFSYVFLSTLTRNNYDDLLLLIEELQRLGHQSKLTLVRGNSFSTFKVPAALLKDSYDPQEKNLSLAPDEIKFLLNKIENKFPNYFYGQQKEKLLLQADTLEAKRRLSPCYAGSDEVVLYSDGKVGLCEQILPFATIKDFKLGLAPLWNSAAAHLQRAGTRDCACIHGCNLSTSLRRAK